MGAKSSKSTKAPPAKKRGRQTARGWPESQRPRAESLSTATVAKSGRRRAGASSPGGVRMKSRPAAKAPRAEPKRASRATCCLVPRVE